MLAAEAERVRAYIRKAFNGIFISNGGYDASRAKRLHRLSCLRFVVAFKRLRIPNHQAITALLQTHQNKCCQVLSLQIVIK